MSQQVFTDEPLELVPCLTAAVAGDGLKTICVCPDGTVRSRKGTFIVDAEGTRMVVAAFEEHGVDLPVDWEHATLGGEFSSPTGRAPAAGWIKKLWYEAGRGILALVGWNDSARDTIKAGEYCYLSPVLSIRPSDRRVVALHSAALTNKPAIPRMERVAAKDTDVTLDDREIAMSEDEKQEGDDKGNGERELFLKIKAALGMEGKRTVVDILRAVLERLEGDTSTVDAEVAASVREKLDLAADAGRDEVVLAMRLSESRQETAERAGKAKAMVDGYIEKGRINPNDEPAIEAAMSLARQHPDRLEALMRDAPYMGPPQGKTKPPDPATTRRDQAIRMAIHSFRDTPGLAEQTTLDAAVDLVLRDKGLPKLSDGELARFL